MRNWRRKKQAMKLLMLLREEYLCLLNLKRSFKPKHIRKRKKLERKWDGEERRVYWEGNNNSMMPKGELMRML